MINKQVKIVGGVNRSTPIDLKTIDAEVAALAGRSPRTPIGMKELWDEVQNLKTTMKQWEIVTLNRSGYNEYPFDSKYSNWNYIVLNGNMRDALTYRRSANSISISINSDTGNKNFSWTKNGNKIVANTYDKDNSATITVLFYK